MINDATISKCDELPRYDALIGESEALNRIRAEVQRLANADSHTLITGETGTGKELVAQLIHANSPRATAPLVCLNCAALPEALLESELFGYERGAFTGAHTLTVGKLEDANGGTVFLDEIGEMSLPGQAKLLRALDSGELYRLGGRRAVRIDVRILAATNRSVDEGTRTGEFRPDLYYRINVGRIHLPPLRERREDILILAEHFCNALSARLNLTRPQMADEVRQALLDYSWPGNIRELLNAIESALLFRPADLIELAHLPDRFKRDLESPPPRIDGERDFIVSALESARWNKTRAAKALGWSRATLYRKLLKHNIE